MHKVAKTTALLLCRSFSYKAIATTELSKGLRYPLCVVVSFLLVLTSPPARSAEPAVGPLYQDFHLTLAPGHRIEILGPVFYYEHKESARLWAVPPLFSYTLDDEVDFSEFDFVYPVLTYDRFGSEYRF